MDCRWVVLLPVVGELEERRNQAGKKSCKGRSWGRGVSQRPLCKATSRYVVCTLPRMSWGFIPTLRPKTEGTTGLTTDDPQYLT